MDLLLQIHTSIDRKLLHLIEFLRIRILLPGPAIYFYSYIFLVLTEFRLQFFLSKYLTMQHFELFQQLALFFDKILSSFQNKCEAIKVNPLQHSIFFYIFLTNFLSLIHMFQLTFNFFHFTVLYFPIFFLCVLHANHHRAFFQISQSITHPVHLHHHPKANQLFFEGLLLNCNNFPFHLSSLHQRRTQTETQTQAKQSQQLSLKNQRLPHSLKISFLELLILYPYLFIYIQILINFQNIPNPSYLPAKFIQLQQKDYKARSNMFFYVRNLPENKIQVKLNESYILRPTDDLYGFMEILVPLIQNKNQLNAFPKQFEISLYSSLEMQLAHKQQQTCLICIEPILRKETIQQQLLEASTKDAYCLKCLHVFHKSCLEDYINAGTWFNCPKCLKMYGKMVGDMPEGMMTSTIDANIKCEGYNCSTIVIKYEMSSGIKNKIPYEDAQFTAYLPYNEEGQQLLKLLQQCFRRKLTFTVNMNKDKQMFIDWAQIPHKTALGNTKKLKNGFPDPAYMETTKKRINAFGIKI